MIEEMINFDDPVVKALIAALFAIFIEILRYIKRRNNDE